MSLAIDVDNVVRVLLADGWHNVADESFSIDAYEFLWSGRDGTRVADMDSDRDPLCLHSGGAGFAFSTDDGDRVCGPVSAILAVKELRVGRSDA